MREFLLKMLKYTTLTLGVLIASMVVTWIFPALTALVGVALIGAGSIALYRMGQGAVEGVRRMFGRGRSESRELSEGLSRSEGRGESRERGLLEGGRTVEEGRGVGRESSPARSLVSRVGGLLDRVADGRDRFYSPRKGFNFNSSWVPSDMSASMVSGDRDRCRFCVDGIPSPVDCQGHPDGSVSLEYLVRDKEVAERVRGAVSGMDVTVVDTPDGTVFRSGDLRDIRSVVLEANPEKTVEVFREFRHTNQFVIPGCSSYEEAVEKYNRMKEFLEPVHSYDEVTDTVDGVVGETRRTDGPLTALGLGVLPVGSYVVSDTSVTVRSGSMSVRGVYDGGRDFDYSRSKIEDGMSIASYLANGTPKDVQRSIVLEDGNPFVLRHADVLDGQDSGLYAYCLCEDPDTVSVVLTGGRFPDKGLTMILSPKDPPSLEGFKDSYLVKIPVDGELLSRLELSGDASPSLLSRCESMGLSAEDIKYSRIIHEVGNGRNGMVKAMLHGGRRLDMDKVLVNGVPASVPALDAEMARQWQEDASHIESVTVKVDVKEAKLKVCSRVYDGRTKSVLERRESFKMTEKDIQDYFRRGAPTVSEMKDLLMRTNPGFFKTYSIEGRPVFVDPVKDFIAGRKVGVKEALARESGKVAVEVKKEKVEKKVKAEKKAVGQKRDRKESVKVTIKR